jgi:hypothetical protein
MSDSGVILIPAFNEAANIGAVIERLRACGLAIPIVVVDDGSSDGTAAVARRLGVEVVAHEHNCGYAFALQTGMRYADQHGFDYVVFLDADGQHDPSFIAALIARAEQPDRPEVVIGSRYVDGTPYSGPLGRRVGMRFFSYVTRALSGTRVFDTTSGFKLLRRRAYQLLQERVLGDFHAEALVFCLMAGLRVEEVPVSCIEREHGSSMYGWTAPIVYPAKTLLAIALLWPRARAVRRGATPV